MVPDALVNSKSLVALSAQPFYLLNGWVTTDPYVYIGQGQLIVLVAWRGWGL